MYSCNGIDWGGGGQRAPRGGQGPFVGVRVPSEGGRGPFGGSEGPQKGVEGLSGGGGPMAPRWGSRAFSKRKNACLCLQRLFH